MFNPQDEANDDHDRTGQGRLPAPQAARLLLEDALRAASASNRFHDLDNLPRGLTIVEVADPIWLWPAAFRRRPESAATTASSIRPQWIAVTDRP